MPNMVTRFQCLFCGRLFVLEHNAKWHEQNRCLRNPAKQACLTCNNFHGKNVKTAEGEYEGITKPFCTHYSGFEVFDINCLAWQERTPTYSYW